MRHSHSLIKQAAALGLRILDLWQSFPLACSRNVAQPVRAQLLIPDTSYDYYSRSLDVKRSWALFDLPSFFCYEFLGSVWRFENMCIQLCWSAGRTRLGMDGVNRVYRFQMFESIFPSILFPNVVLRKLFLLWFSYLELFKR
jgi:hypothetical protein